MTDREDPGADTESPQASLRTAVSLHGGPTLHGDASPPVRAHIGLGTNLGDRLATVEAAIWTVHETEGIDVLDTSGVWETAPWGGVDQPAYLNAVIAVATSLGPHELLADLQATEAAFGRDRATEQRWGPRLLDLDLLLYGDDVIDTDDLQVPHPRILERAFVLIPLLEVAPGMVLPDGTRVTEALGALAPIEGIDLHIRLQEVPGRRGVPRPAGPAGPGARLASPHERDPLAHQQQ